MITKAEPWGSAFVLPRRAVISSAAKRSRENSRRKVSCRDGYQWCRAGEGTLRKQFSAGKKHQRMSSQ